MKRERQQTQTPKRKAEADSRKRLGDIEELKAKGPAQRRRRAELFEKLQGQLQSAREARAESRGSRQQPEGAMKPAANLVAPSRRGVVEGEDAVAWSEIRYGSGDPIGPLDSDDVEWLQAQEAKRAAKETRRCGFCGAAFNPVSPYPEECASLGRHEQRCRKASTAERTFYAEHRRWPRADQVDPAEEEAA